MTIIITFILGSIFAIVLMGLCGILRRVLFGESSLISGILGLIILYNSYAYAHEIAIKLLG